MRILFLALVLLVPSLGLGQSLAEVAKKEKERRDKNKQEGKTVRVISEQELFPEPEETGADAPVPDTGVATATAPARATRGTSEREARAEEEGRITGEDERASYDVPDRIPADAPLDEKLQLFELMKRDYENKVNEINVQIAENNEQLRQLDAKIAATSALGGGGLPVAPTTGTGAETAPMTGQDTQYLVGEKEKLETMNQRMEARKEQLKLDLQTKGRVAGIPPGYLRF